MKKCPKCKKKYRDYANYCVFDGELLENTICEEFFEEQQEERLFIPRCPTCGSPDVEHNQGKIKGIYDRNFSKSYKCNNCQYRW